MIEGHGDKAHQEQAMVLFRINLKLQGALAVVQEEFGLRGSDRTDLTHSFMAAAGENLGELVRINRGKQDIIARIKEGLDQQQPVVLEQNSPEEALAIAEGILSPQGVSLQQMRRFYTHQERSIFARGLNEQAEGASTHPIIARMLDLMFPFEK